METRAHTVLDSNKKWRQGVVLVPPKLEARKMSYRAFVSTPNRHGLREFGLACMVIAVSLFGLGGCVVLDAIRAGEEAEVRKIFHQQSVVSKALMYAIVGAETNNPSVLALLESAEEKLSKACEPFQKIISKKFDGKEIGSDLKNKVYNARHICETAAHEVATLLWARDKETAHFYLRDQFPPPRKK